MVDMKRLSVLARGLEERLTVCTRCGMCQSVCPVFAETCRESDVARGKLALLDGLVQEMFKNPEGVRGRLSRCLLCGSCAANCPSGVRALDIFLEARAILTGYMGLSPVKKIIFRGMLAHPKLFDGLMEWGAGLQGLFIKPANTFQGTSCGRMLPLPGERHVRALAPVPFHRAVPSLNTAPGASGIKVGFFPGCLVDKVYPNVASAVLSALEHHGTGVFLPEGPGCCGIPALSSGDLPAFDRLVRHNLEIFAEGEFDYLVTACATCTATIRKYWPAMSRGLSGAERKQAEALAEKTLDISQFLVDKLGVAARTAPEDAPGTAVTYHDPCHLKKSLGIGAQPRTILAASGGCRLVEMDEPDRCCGCGGGFNLQHYDLSASIGKRKREDILRTGCGVVATSCPACMLHITDMLSRAGNRVRVRHAIEIYAESLDRR